LLHRPAKRERKALLSRAGGRSRATALSFNTGEKGSVFAEDIIWQFYLLPSWRGSSLWDMCLRLEVAGRWRW
jgi:hypothetical protein